MLQQSKLAESDRSSGRDAERASDDARPKIDDRFRSRACPSDDMSDPAESHRHLQLNCLTGKRAILIELLVELEFDRGRPNFPPDRDEVGPNHKAVRHSLRLATPHPTTLFNRIAPAKTGQISTRAPTSLCRAAIDKLRPRVGSLFGAATGGGKGGCHQWRGRHALSSFADPDIVPPCPEPLLTHMQKREQGLCARNVPRP